MNIENINQRQFDNTMLKEGIEVTDYYDASKTYQVFFRRNNRGTTPQGKLRLFYAQDSGISIGTIFVLKGENYLVTSQDSQESNIYYTSLAMRCSATFNVHYNGRYNKIPFVVASDRYSVAENNTISIISGSVIVYTGLNDIVDNMTGQYKNFGGTYEVKNHFYNDGLAYIYMSREADSPDVYLLEYIGITELDIKDGTYQLSYTATKNGEVISEPILTYASSDETVATVDAAGLLTLVADGNVVITATWTEGNVLCKSTITVGGASPAGGTSSISGGTTLRCGRVKSWTVTFTDSSGNVVEDVTPVWTFTNCSFESSITKSTTANKISLRIDDENLIDETFTLNATDVDGNFTASSVDITVIEGL